MPDHYDVFTSSEDDIDNLFVHLRTLNIITFNYCAEAEGDLTCYVMSIVGPLKTECNATYGGNVKNAFLVSIRSRGANYFHLFTCPELHPEYLSEKLNIPIRDAKSVGYLLNGLRERFQPKSSE